MRPNRLPVWAVAVVSLVVAVAFARGAGARTCDAGADCPLGFQCTAADGGQGSSCVSKPCESSADCAAGFSCYDSIECVPGPEASSVPGNLCVPQWQGRCTADGDCGQGYQCVISSQACDCSGTGSGVPPDAGAVSEPCSQAEPPQPPCAGNGPCPSIPSICDAGGSCLCWGITRWCQPIQTAPTSCSSAAACLSGWTCSSTTCAPPNSDLAYQGPLGGGTLVCGGLVPGAGFGGAGGIPGGGSMPSGSGTDAGNTLSSSGGARASGGGSSGCAVGAPRPTGTVWPAAFVLGVASAAVGRRRTRARLPCVGK